MKRSNTSFLVAVIGSGCLSCLAGDWTYQWTPGTGEGVAQADITPFRYGKSWAYTVEIDDGPVSTLTVAQPLLAQQQFTDAPPGVAGGKAMPFVGGAAVMTLRTDTTNNTYLKWSDLRTLQSDGWGILNHSYSHIGQSYDPVVNLTAQQVRRELFWSQAVAITELGGTSGKTPSHFVYPNGYMGYQPYLAEYGLTTASRVGASDPSKGLAYAANAAWTDLDRNNLDGSSWSSGAMTGFPSGAGPAAGRVVIDFTHGIDASAASANQQLWSQRLTTIATQYGKAGADNVWSAPTGEIYDYAAARKAATVSTQPGKVTLSLPNTAPGTALTLHLTGLKADTVLPPSPGATIYRSGSEAWVTSPEVQGEPSLMAQLQVERIYSGPMKNLTWATPVTLAGVRISQFGSTATGFQLKLDAQKPDGQIQSLVPPGQETLGTEWGSWLLYDLVPNQSGVPATKLTVTTDNALQQMEVWAVVPEPTSLGLLALAIPLMMRGRRAD